MPKVVITLPAYRAAQTVAKTVADVPSELAEHMILVDDSSPDDTVERARSLGLRVFVHTENRGYGANLKTCYLQALDDQADVIVVLHPDYQYDPKAVPALIAPILAGDADMTFGSRFAGIGDPRSQGMPFYRFLGNRITTVIQNVMLGTRFSEMHSGMRAYTRDCLLALPFLAYSNDFVFESQILVDAVVKRYRVVEVPIPTRYTTESSSLHLRGLFKYVWETVAHTGRRTARWGRRGRRWPTAKEKARPRRTLRDGSRAVAPTDVSLSEKVGAEIVDAVLERIQAYLLPGTTVAVVAGSEEWLSKIDLAAGWQHVVDPATKADAVVVISGKNELDAVLDAAASAADSLAPEGMLAVVAPSAVLNASPDDVAAGLEARKMRFIDWDQVGRLVPRWTLVLARQRSS